jgi:uncharacterized membrane protein YheB (UPF0754 family)
MNHLERYEYYKAQQERQFNFTLTNHAMADIERRIGRRPQRIQAVIDLENFLNDSENKISKIPDEKLRNAKLDQLKLLYKVHDTISQMLTAEMYALTKLDEAKEKILELEQQNYDLATKINMLEL